MKFDKMFKLSPKEFKTTKHEEEKVLDNDFSMDRLSKIAAVMTMFMLPQYLETENKENKSEVELKVLDAKIMLDHSREYVNKHDTDVKTLNDVEYREANFEGGKNIKIAEDANYAIFSKEDGGKAYLDANCDGRVNRVIINEHYYHENSLQSEADQRMLDNNFYLFDSIENLKERAKVEAELRPKPIKVVFLDYESMSITILDSENGEIISSQNGQGEAAIESLQSAYAHDLKEICREMLKG